MFAVEIFFGPVKNLNIDWCSSELEGISKNHLVSQQDIQLLSCLYICMSIRSNFAMIGWRQRSSILLTENADNIRLTHLDKWPIIDCNKIFIYCLAYILLSSSLSYLFHLFEISYTLYSSLVILILASQDILCRWDHLFSCNSHLP